MTKSKFKFYLSILILFLVAFFIYKFTSAGNTPYDYFTRLSSAFLQGRYWLTENPPWLNELIPAGPNRFYVPYPPMPALITIPFILVFKNNFQQQHLAYLVGAGLVVLTTCLSWQIKKDKVLALWSGLLVGFGTIIWYLSSVGSSWYLGQLTAAFFLTAALVESVGKKRPFIVGLLLGGAYLSRLQIILSLPLFLYLLRGNQPIKRYFIFALGISPFFIFNAFYNFIRFGVIWDKGYYLIPGLFSESWYENGLFNLSYIPRHLKIIFASFPRTLKEPPYIIPTWAGLAIWITTPTFVLSLFANLKEKLVLITWFSIALIALVIFSHGTTGFTQFGYRFAVDFYPLLIFLTIKGAVKLNSKYIHWGLLILSILVNLWGAIWINKFGWVSF